MAKHSPFVQDLQLDAFGLNHSLKGTVVTLDVQLEMFIELYMKKRERGRQGGSQ